MTLIILKAAVIPLKCYVASGSESLLVVYQRKPQIRFFSSAELQYTVTAGCCIMMRCTQSFHQGCSV